MMPCGWDCLGLEGGVYLLWADLSQACECRYSVMYGKHHMWHECSSVGSTSGIRTTYTMAVFFPLGWFFGLLY